MKQVEKLALESYGKFRTEKGETSHCGLCFCDGYERGFKKSLELAIRYLEDEACVFYYSQSLRNIADEELE